jgi:flagellin
VFINHNIIALRTFNFLQKNTKKKDKELQRLYTGLRINSASDDTAGLAISEKMKALINGLEQGSQNAQDGINLLNVADGALSSIDDSLQRVRELLVQKNNGTNTADDQSKIDNEINQLIIIWIQLLIIRNLMNRIYWTVRLKTKKSV